MPKATARAALLSFAVCIGIHPAKASPMKICETLFQKLLAHAKYQEQLDALKVRQRALLTKVPAYFKDAQKAFDDYVALRAQKISEPLNLPFVLHHDGKTKNVVYLMSGMVASPFYLRDIAEVFHRRGWTVIGDSLPGVGGKSHKDIGPNDLASWQDAFDRGSSIAKGMGDHLYLGGNSTGGALAIDAFLSNGVAGKPNPVTGLVLFSPTLEMNVPGVDLALLAPNFNLPGPFSNNRDFKYHHGFIPTQSIKSQVLLSALNAERLKSGDSNYQNIAAPMLITGTDADKVIRNPLVHGLSEVQGSPTTTSYFAPADQKVLHQNFLQQDANPHFGDLETAINNFIDKNP